MPTNIETRRKNRAILGHPAREQMLAWNRGEGGQAAVARYKATEAYKQKRQRDDQVGGIHYEYTQATRIQSRLGAFQARSKWTADQYQMLRLLLQQGYTHPNIALALQRSLQAVEHKIYILKKNNDPSI